MISLEHIFLHHQHHLHSKHHSYTSTSTFITQHYHQQQPPTVKMKFSLAFVAAVLSTGALAAPVVDPDSVSMMAVAPQWTIQTLQRTCDKADKNCTWNFKINSGSGAATTCTYAVKGSPASQAKGGPAKCGDYTISKSFNSSTFEVHILTISKLAVGLVSSVPATVSPPSPLSTPRSRSSTLPTPISRSLPARLSSLTRSTPLLLSPSKRMGRLFEASDRLRSSCIRFLFLSIILYT